jgi:hypothetical protein
MISTKEKEKEKREKDVHSTQVVRVGDKKVFLSIGNQLVKNARMVKSIV